MPIVELKILEGRDRELKERLLENVTKTVSETLGVDAERVRVILYEIPQSHWAIGGKTADKRSMGK